MCGSSRHKHAKSLAWAGIFLYPVGISFVYILLLLRARRSILDERPTALSKALGFLIRDFKKEFFWWELFETWKKVRPQRRTQHFCFHDLTGALVAHSSF